MRRTLILAYQLAACDDESIGVIAGGRQMAQVGGELQEVVVATAESLKLMPGLVADGVTAAATPIALVLFLERVRCRFMCAALALQVLRLRCAAQYADSSHENRGRHHFHGTRSDVWPCHDGRCPLTEASSKCFRNCRWRHCIRALRACRGSNETATVLPDVGGSDG